VETHAIQLANVIKEQEQGCDLKPYIVLLGHQYTPENFSEQSLKLNDPHKADILFREIESRSSELIKVFRILIKQRKKNEKHYEHY